MNIKKENEIKNGKVSLPLKTHTHTHTHTRTRTHARAHTRTHTHTHPSEKKTIYITNTEKNPLPLQLSRLLPVATDDDDDDRTRRSPLAHFACAIIRKFPHCPSHRARWNCVQAFIADCCLPRRQWSTSTEIDSGASDGLAASSPVSLCRKFWREDSQKARLERKRAAAEHRDVQHRVSGFVGFRSSATRLSVHSLQLRGSRSLRKSRSQL